MPERRDDFPGAGDHDSTFMMRGLWGHVAATAALLVVSCTFEVVDLPVQTARRTCGNARPDPGEVCDDGNNHDGDGCSADCQSNERCGNGFVDRGVGEVCDDGNTVGGDGCSADCRSVEVCGNFILDPGEVCDDGNTVGGDGCSADCQSVEVCGNAILDPGEECDEGAGVNADDADCRSDCIVNRCGDGRIDLRGAHREDCDGAVRRPDGDATAAPTETATCNRDCTVPRCGDGQINGHFTPPGTAGPEQCDDGTGNSDNADCTASCQVNVCGDGRVDRLGAHREQCDDGNVANGDLCTNTCNLPACGDGIISFGEQCDDAAGNGAGQRCSASCQLNVCGDGDRLIGVEQCDGGTGSPRDTATCDADCTFPVCGDGHVNVVAGETCDDGALNGTPGSQCSTSCRLL
jgi:cysteine-rich repeat protein